MSQRGVSPQSQVVDSECGGGGVELVEEPPQWVSSLSPCSARGVLTAHCCYQGGPRLRRSRPGSTWTASFRTAVEDRCENNESFNSREAARPGCA